jgi:hypothetical protein
MWPSATRESRRMSSSLKRSMSDSEEEECGDDEDLFSDTKDR